MEKVIRHLRPIFWVVLFSFLIRLAFIILVPPSIITIEGDDAGLYELTALQLREYFKEGGSLLKEFLSGDLFRGQGMLEKYGLEIPWGAIKKGPVYPFFVALFFWIAGPEPFWVFLAQALLVSLAGVFFYGIARGLGQEGAGLLCAFLVGVYPPFIFITQKLLQESLAIFFFTLFYFLVFRSRRTNSAWFFGLLGMVLLLLAFTKSRLAFFPFFLFGVMGVTSQFVRQRIFSARNLVVLLLSFSIPYFLWATVVSWQVRKPAVVRELGGMQTITGLLPDYQGWAPDGFLDHRPGPEVKKILKREGILWDPEKEKWPSDSKMIGAGLKILWRHPWISLGMGLERFQRIWWHPYDWPWREFFIPREPLRWFHRGMVIAALCGMVLWGFERPLAVWFLLMPLLYAVPAHGFFHIETRYLLPFIPFLFPFASFFIALLWKERKILFGPSQKFLLGLGFVLMGSLIFRWSRPSLLLKFSDALSASQAHLLGVGVRSLVLVGFFFGAFFWLKRVLHERRLLTCLGVTAFFVLIPFESHSFTTGDWREWKAALRQPTEGIRQEIFLPEGSIIASRARNLRLDLLPPERGESWAIRVNGESIGTLEMLKASPSPFLLLPPYSVYLKDAGKQPYRVRQWFSLPIPQELLKEGTFNTIEIVFNQKNSVPPLADEWTLFGDYPIPSPSPQFQGPLFLHSITEFSVFKFVYDGDLRITGVTPLHHQGVESFYRRGGREDSDDLSDAAGIQRGEYRIRIEMEDREGKFLVY